MRVLIVRLDHMGDIALTVPPIVESLHEAYSDIRIDLLTTSAGEAIMREDGNIHKLDVFDAPWSVPPPGHRSTPKMLYVTRCLAFLTKRLLTNRTIYDVIIFLSFSPWERFLLAWQGKNRIGFRGPYRRRLFRLSNHLMDESSEFVTDMHVLENGFQLVKTVFKNATFRPTAHIRISKRRYRHGRDMVKGIRVDTRILVMIHAGTSESMKTWPFENYLEVAGWLEEKLGAGCVFVGTPSEVGFYKASVGNGGEFPYGLLSTPEVEDLLCAIANADLFISNDGGPMHIASSLGIPTVGIFGPTDERVYGPRGPSSRVVRQKGLCGRRQYPWGTDTCCRYKNRECLLGIEVATVLEVVQDIIEEKVYSKGNSGSAVG